MNISIGFLHDYPKYQAQVVQWRFDQWSKVTGLSLEEYTQSVTQHLNRDRIPFTLLALESEKPIGMVSVREKDLETSENFSPWLASLFVVPKYRRSGVGSYLVKATETVAKQMNYTDLFIYICKQDLKGWYGMLGYDFVREGSLHSHKVWIMKKELKSDTNSY